jgi:hypothetical protein
LNLELAQRVCKQITAFPESYRMECWVGEPEEGCGTVACIAGHAMLMSGYSYTKMKDPDSDSVLPGAFLFVRPDGTEVDSSLNESEAISLLELTDEEYEGEDGIPLFHDYLGDSAATRLRILIEQAEDRDKSDL